MNGVYLLLGSNLGDRLLHLREAARLIQSSGLVILNESSIYETEPWGKQDQDWFLNVVLQVETNQSPEDLLKICLEIEKKMGRVRSEKWAERLIDIDLLYYDSTVLESDKLTVPHPAIQERRFTLIPMCELAPNELNPVLNQTQQELLSKCTDTLDCRLTEFHL